MDESGPFYIATVRRRRQKRSPPTMNDADSVYKLMHPIVGSLDREHFYVVHLNCRNQVLDVDLVSVGSLNNSIVHPREVFKRAIELSTAAVILVHNHPSGDPEPSAEDNSLTRRLVDAGELLGVAVLDHVVLGNGDYRSLKALGHLPLRGQAR